jgi:hypothetical protein
MLSRLFLSFVPGGWIARIAVAAARFLARFLYWLMADIADAFKEPMRAVVRFTCGVLVLCVGVWLGIEHMAAARDEWRLSSKKWEAAHDKLIIDAEKADADNKGKLAASLAARGAAEAAERTRIAKEGKAAGPAPAAGKPRAHRMPKRTGKGAAGSQDAGGGQGMQWLYSLFGGGGQAQSK